MSCKSILVVEDDEDIRRQVVQALELEDYEVHQASNGQEALNYLLSLPESQNPMCMILDLMMPIMDGKTLMQEIHDKHKSRLGSIPIIVATAKASPVETNLPYAVERVQKPFNLDELYRVVKEHCG